MGLRVGFGCVFDWLWCLVCGCRLDWWLQVMWFIFSGGWLFFLVAVETLVCRGLYLVSCFSGLSFDFDFVGWDALLGFGLRLVCLHGFCLAVVIGISDLLFLDFVVVVVCLVLYWWFVVLGLRLLV